MNQRWRAHRSSYRPAGEPIQTHAYEVAEIADDNPAKAFVEAHHYSGSFPAARFRYGLYRRGALVGVAVFSHPCNNAVLTNVFPVPANDATELGRFVLLDDVPGNGETWFLARCFEKLRHEVAGVVSFSDPVPRTTADGHTVMPGHVGTICQAFNGFYLDRSRAEPHYLLPDGTLFSRRNISKIRLGHQGWRYAAATLERYGATPIRAHDPKSWLDTWLPRLTRKFRHPGNHRYAWALDRSLRKHLGAKAGKPYPKVVDASARELQCQEVSTINSNGGR